MSSRSTISLSLGQMYCCLRRVPHFLCSRLKLTAAAVSLEEKRETGTETSPNEMVAEALWRAGIGQRQQGFPTACATEAACLPLTISRSPYLNALPPSRSAGALPG